MPVADAGGRRIMWWSALFGMAIDLGRRLRRLQPRPAAGRRRRPWPRSAWSSTACPAVRRPPPARWRRRQRRPGNKAMRRLPPQRLARARDPLAAVRSEAAERGGGCYVGFSTDGTATWVGAHPEHAVLVLGPPRSGKTSAIIVPAVIAHPGAVVSTSTKPEVAAITAPAAGPGRRGVAVRPHRHRGPRRACAPLRWSPVGASGTWDGALVMARAMVAASATGRRAQRRGDPLERARGGPAGPAAARRRPRRADHGRGGALGAAGRPQRRRLRPGGRGGRGGHRRAVPGGRHPRAGALVDLLDGGQRAGRLQRRGGPAGGGRAQLRRRRLRRVDRHRVHHHAGPPPGPGRPAGRRAAGGDPPRRLRPGPGRSAWPRAGCGRRCCSPSTSAPTSPPSTTCRRWCPRPAARGSRCWPASRTCPRSAGDGAPRWPRASCRCSAPRSSCATSPTPAPSTRCRSPSASTTARWCRYSQGHGFNSSDSTSYSTQRQRVLSQGEIANLPPGYALFVQGVRWWLVQLTPYYAINPWPAVLASGPASVGPRKLAAGGCSDGRSVGRGGGWESRGLEGAG